MNLFEVFRCGRSARLSFDCTPFYPSPNIVQLSRRSCLQTRVSIPTPPFYLGYIVSRDFHFCVRNSVALLPFAYSKSLLVSFRGNVSDPFASPCTVFEGPPLTCRLRMHQFLRGLLHPRCYNVALREQRVTDEGDSFRVPRVTGRIMLRTPLGEMHTRAVAEMRLATRGACVTAVA